MSLPRFGVTKPVPVNLLMLAMLLAGLASGITLRRQFFPETNPEQASVTLPYPGATPEEIEETLAIKTEDALADLNEVDTLRTTISEGAGGIIVEFREGTRDIRKAVDEVERAVDALLDLPEDAETIQVKEFEERLPVIMVTVYGDVDEEVLKRSIRQIRDDLKTLPGMGEVLISGVRDYEIRVDVEADALLRHRISLPQVAGAIRGWMADVPGGSVRGTSGNVAVRTMGVRERASAIRQIVVKADVSGQAVRVGDIANVRESYVDEQLITRFNGKPSATLTVFKLGGQDIVKMARAVRAYIDGRHGEDFLAAGLERRGTSARQGAWELGRTTPPLAPGVAVAAHSDLARFVEGRLDLLLRNALYGSLLVFLTLMVFLNWRVAFWVGVGLITAIAGTLVLMKALDITLNLLTMFGLIVVLGILVDDAIVVAENVQAHHDRGEASLPGAISGAEEVGWPVLATVLTSIVAFLPLMFVKGRIGDLLGALPIVVACALIMSLVECLLILPSHMGHGLLHRDRAKVNRFIATLRRFEAWRDSIILDRIVPAFGSVLETCLRYRYVTLTTALAVLIASVGMLAGGRLAFVFLPSDDTETIVVEVRMPLGTPIGDTSAVVERIERAAAAQEETRSVSAVIGQRSDLNSGSIDSSATHLAQLFIELKPTEERDRPSDEVITTVRQLVGIVHEAERISFDEVTGGPAGPDITIELQGETVEELSEASLAVRAELMRFTGVLDAFDDNSLGQRELQINLKPGAASLGFTVADVAAQVRGALFGIDAHVFSRSREDIDVRVRLDEATRRNLYAIESLWVISPSGRRVPLVEIAELVDGESFATIRRVDRQRTVTVFADTVPGVSPESITAKFTLEALPSLQERFPQVGFRFGGRQKQMSDAFASLPYGFLAAMIMIYVILAWLFSSYMLPFTVMLAVPFGVIGVIWGHLLLGFDLTFLSLIGFVALSGIVVNDSLILMQFYRNKRAEGLSLHDGLVMAGRARLRPIFLTTVTTVLGLTPLMLEQSFQARFLIPMAISISFGLISGTVLILLVLPCLVVIADDLKAVTYYLWNGMPRQRLDTSSRPDVLGEA